MFLPSNGILAVLAVAFPLAEISLDEKEKNRYVSGRRSAFALPFRTISSSSGYVETVSIHIFNGYYFIGNTVAP